MKFQNPRLHFGDMDATKPYQRNIFLINRPFQLKFSLYVCSWIFALSLLYPLVISNLFDLFFQSIQMDPLAAPITKIKQTQGEVVTLLWLFQAFFIAVTFVLSLFISHRIAGPIYKLRKSFGAVRSGDLTQEIHFREKDHFQELAQDYNGLIRSLRDSAARNQQRLTDAVSRLEALQQNSANDQKRELEAILALLREAREQTPH